MAAPARTEPELPQLLVGVKERMLDEMRARLHEQGFEEIREPHGHVFRFLHQGPMRLSDMAERSGLTKQALGEHVDFLESHGYVAREPDPADGRAKLVVATERGEAAMAAARQVFADVERSWAHRLGAERIRALRQTLEDVLALPS
jgi:DNA-binding MarR family transcriptional regulator